MRESLEAKLRSQQEKDETDRRNRLRELLEKQRNLHAPVVPAQKKGAISSSEEPSGVISEEDSSMCNSSILKMDVSGSVKDSVAFCPPPLFKVEIVARPAEEPAEEPAAEAAEEPAVGPAEEPADEAADEPLPSTTNEVIMVEEVLEQSDCEQAPEKKAGSIQKMLKARKQKLARKKEAAEAKAAALAPAKLFSDEEEEEEKEPVAQAAVGTSSLEYDADA